jgi:hypothetical protein
MGRLQLPPNPTAPCKTCLDLIDEIARRSSDLAEAMADLGRKVDRAGGAFQQKPRLCLQHSDADARMLVPNWPNTEV